MTDDEKQAIVRLRESKANALKTLFEDGKAAGIEYVLDEQTDYMQLARLETWARTDGEVWGDVCFRPLAREMDEDEGDYIYEAMHGRYGPIINNPIWAKGFISGLLGKFKKLKPHLA